MSFNIQTSKMKTWGLNALWALAVILSITACGEKDDSLPPTPKGNVPSISKDFSGQENVLNIADMPGQTNAEKAAAKIRIWSQDLLKEQQAIYASNNDLDSIFVVSMEDFNGIVRSQMPRFANGLDALKKSSDSIAVVNKVKAPGIAIKKTVNPASVFLDTKTFLENAYKAQIQARAVVER